MEQLIKEQTLEQMKRAKQASRRLSLLTQKEKDRALYEIGKQLLQSQETILAANQQDLMRAEQDGQPASYLDRLRLTPERLQDLVDSLHQLAEQTDPVGEVITSWTRPNGLIIEQVRVPLGVIGMVYEARPNVTVDAAAIALKTGNAIVLRGSRSALESNLALTACIRQALTETGLPEEAVQYLPYPDHAVVDVLCTANALIDVIIPRGGANLIQRVLRTSTVPVLETGVGNCHVFIDKTAAYDMAEAIILNAKTSRPGVCNAAETLLLHKDWPQEQQAALLSRLLTAGIALRACEKTRTLHPELAERLAIASPEDWDTEYLELTLAVRTVDSLDDALEHISIHGTGHSEAIIAEDAQRAQRFLSGVDAAAVYHNASTRFTDGGEFGFGAEIGISTQKLHARGPMGLIAITTSKYLVRGSGQIR
ncbi:glutamate-5-semialdehyde dehydrogenase [Brevibacillus ruminantium]|uniref:Gamma-glutamyl phosphate reductase n=1 Tax=Brevibacillus ruminantium TaxID=2950604 RepID=A0ABY4WI25_9BACL|nr:glutamate-5-semialdehyde dehydrogenase [Brevibacillus ruminantium]USG66708.1 glutamate-5-semialdehyde dehydrogenase [Brevibacillus ruminantium]